MNKAILLIAIMALFLCFTSCDSEEDIDELGAVIEISVVNQSNVKQSGVSVCMFPSETNQTFGDNPMHAKKTVVSDSKGIASFELQDTFDLNIIDSQTTFYFTVFMGKENKILGTVGVTVKKGETKSSTLKIQE